MAMKNSRGASLYLSIGVFRGVVSQQILTLTRMTADPITSKISNTKGLLLGMA